MGGHGFCGPSGFIQLNNDYLSKPTVEGDNWMITQQTASYLIKRMQAALASKGQPQDEIEASCWTYLDARSQHQPSQLQIFERDEDIVEAFVRRSRDQTYRAHVERNEKHHSWNSMLIRLRKVSHSESQAILVANFHEAIQSDSISVALKKHLQVLFRLFALYAMDADARDFARAKAVSDDDLDALPAKIQDLMAQIRPHAVRLVDSWKIPDFLLDSALGRYDGKVYEDLFNRAHRLNPLNEITFNSNYKSEEIIMGAGDDGVKKIMAKL